MKRSILAVPVVVAAVGAGTLLHGGGPASAADPSPASANSGVVVDGLGKVTGTPDVLTATLGVSLRRSDVGAALATANDLQAKIAAALKKDGVAAADVQTSNVSVNPSYDNHGQRNGYQVDETLTARLHDVPRAGRTLGDAVTAGGSSAVLQGVGFSLEGDSALLGRARDAAFADAKAKAQRYAELSGRSLGDVQLIAETTTPPPDLLSFAKGSAGASAAPAARPVPIEVGSQQVNVTVTVRFALR